ncbi:MAG: hypothetical protein Q9227_003666 [Pyrenula ochraceoflavens]
MLLHACNARQYILVLTFLCLTLALLQFWHGSSHEYLGHDVESSYYHLLVPASEASPGLCKTLFSAAASGYSTPRLLNWQRKFEDEHLIFGGSHIAKIEGVLGFLRQLGPQSDHELVLIIDGYDVWFQLLPEVMISRYHQINQRANRRIRSSLGSLAAEKEDIRQTVVFAAQKKCWPASPDDPACFAVPPSELEEDVYGPQTDLPVDDEKNPFARMRQRYLNSGMIMGPVDDVRRIMERASQKASVSTNFGSDQGIFAEIFGEQEYQRQVARLRHMSWLQRMRKNIASKMFGPSEQDNITLPHPTHHRMSQELLEEKNYEFHMGLDHRSELSQPTVFSENDLAWIKHTDQEDIREKSSLVGIDDPSLNKLSPEIAGSTPPFWILGDVDSATRLPKDSRWDQMPLYANMWTGFIPAAVHHNAHHDGLKERIRTFWNETWYFPYLRDLLQVRLAEIRSPVAVVPTPSDGSKVVQKEWWDPTDERGGARIETGVLPGDWLTWQQLCGSNEIAEEIFRDDRGPWNDPVVFLSWDHEFAETQIAKWREQTEDR